MIISLTWLNHNVQNQDSHSAKITPKLQQTSSIAPLSGFHIIMPTNTSFGLLLTADEARKISNDYNTRTNELKHATIYINKQKSRDKKEDYQSHER